MEQFISFAVPGGFAITPFAIILLWIVGLEEGAAVAAMSVVVAPLVGYPLLQIARWHGEPGVKRRAAKTILEALELPITNCKKREADAYRRWEQALCEMECFSDSYRILRARTSNFLYALHATKCGALAGGILGAMLFLGQFFRYREWTERTMAHCEYSSLSLLLALLIATALEALLFLLCRTRARMTLDMLIQRDKRRIEQHGDDVKKEFFTPW